MFARILILDDNKQNAKELQQCVDRLGHDAVVVHRLIEAVNALKTQEFDLAISTVHLEHESALDLLRAVKSDARWKQLPVLFVSLRQTEMAKTVNDCVEIACRALGASKYIAMDTFDPDVLCDEIRGALPNVLRERWGAARASGDGDGRPGSDSQ